MKPLTAVLCGCVVGALALSFAATVRAQESKSSPLAKQLTDALDGAKLMAIAAKDPSQEDVFVGGMYLPGMLLVVSAKFSVPAALDQKISKKDYAEVYLDLQSASNSSTKVFVQDRDADGLKFKTFDSVDTATASTSFDGDWRKSKAASEEEYGKTFADLDAQYAQMLATLLAAVKKAS